MEEDEWRWLGQWFSLISPWDTDERSEERLIEIQVHGLPVVFWKKDNLEKIPAIWGKLNTVECNVINLDDIRVCTFTMTTNQKERIEEIVEVWCGNFTALIRINESNMVVKHVEDVGLMCMPNYQTTSSERKNETENGGSSERAWDESRDEMF